MLRLTSLPEFVYSVCVNRYYFCLDPSMMTEMMKGNITNVLPMIIIGGWINWAFSGFLTSELCFVNCYYAEQRSILQKLASLFAVDLNDEASLCLIHLFCSDSSSLH